MPKITDEVYYIPGQDEFMPDSHTYLLGKPSSQDLSLIDAGLTGKGNYKIQSILNAGFELKAIKRIIMTHTHLDHIGCLTEIQKQIPWAELWMHQLEADLLEQGDERAVYGMEMFRGFCEDQFGLKPGAFKFKVHRKLNGGEIFDLGDSAWEVLHIPGHSMGSIGLYHRPMKILIPGDVIYADYAIGRFDLYGANGPELKKSLMRLAELEVNILLPGHNQIVRGLPKGYILQTAKQWEAYLR
ncbi:MAG: MBL fold metallo-hydrolase [Syntrophaceae bacterium]|nr:MBL fold metallo-hydrolase [Syntrophaceae bacterium]